MRGETGALPIRIRVQKNISSYSEPLMNAPVSRKSEQLGFNSRQPGVNYIQLGQNLSIKKFMIVGLSNSLEDLSGCIGTTGKVD